MTAPIEFSRVVRVDSLPGDGLNQKISATAQERAALAERFRIPAVCGLEGQFLIRRAGRGVRVTGTVRGQVTQVCVVSAELFDGEVEEEVNVRFEPPEDEKRRPSKVELEVRFEDEDEPDELIDGRIDLGELAAEFLALGLDPYPRKPGVEFAAPEIEDETPKPFAKLARLKPDRDERS